MMNTRVYNELKSIINDNDFFEKCSVLVEEWLESNLGLDAVEAILITMEENSAVDFGTPGPLVHFVEKYYKMGYEQILVQSILKVPTKHTLWMLNRIINGTKEDKIRKNYIKVMKRVAGYKDDSSVADLAKHFIEIQNA